MGTNHEGCTAVVIPTYNEAETIDTILRQLLEMGYQPIVVDDGTDNTPEICQKLGVLVFHRFSKQGLGSAIKLGIEVANGNGARRVVVMDAGGNHLPAAVPLLERAVFEGADVAIGSRFKGHYAYAGWRTALSRVAAMLVSAMLGEKLHDVTTSFRCYLVTPKLLMALVATEANGHAFQFELLSRLMMDGAKVTEVPAYYRMIGKSTLRASTVVEAVLTYIRLCKEKGQSK